MGMPVMSVSSYERAETTRAGNPDPFVFSIIRAYHAGEWTALEVEYPGCTNYEGHKIMVMYTKWVYHATSAFRLDPHFSDTGPSPIARFEPTERGWKWATEFAERVAKEDE